MNNRHEILKEAQDTRTAEVLSYQINIDNYRRAIVLAKSDPELIDFTAQLQQLLTSSVLEQKKAKIMLTVIEDQLADDAAGT